MFEMDPNRSLLRSVAGAQEVLPVLYKSDFQVAGGNKTTVAAVSGKRIKVIGLFAQSYGGVMGTLGMYSNSTGGTLLFGCDPPVGTVAAGLLLPINPLGYFETNTGQALIAAAATGNVEWTIQYIVYTP